MKRLAKHFPMSMLACLGSEAEAVRQHFLAKLDAVTEDVRVKVALLDFLAVCVKHQPGLIEMFVNVEPEEENDETSSCILTVLEILREKMENKYFCPVELHAAALKFLGTFWNQSHLLAIDQLKKQKDLWQLVCFPLFTVSNDSGNDELANINEKLVSFIFRILAREIFLVKSLEKFVDWFLFYFIAFYYISVSDCIYVEFAFPTLISIHLFLGLCHPP